MKLLTRRKFLLGGVVVGGGWYWASRDVDTEVSTDDLDDHFVKSDESITLSGEESYIGEQLEVPESGLVVSKVSFSGGGGIARLVSPSSDADNVILYDGGSEVVETINTIQPHTYKPAIYPEGGEWQVDIFIYNTENTNTHMEPTISTSGSGRTAVGPIKFNSSYPTEFTISGNGDLPPRVELYSITGALRKTLFDVSYTNQNEYRQREHLGGVGFVGVVHDSEWELEINTIGAE